ncbi:MAG: carbohydrate porin [Chlamydiia bacterium]
MLFHSERIFHYSGGEFFYNFQAHEGKNPSFNLTGDQLGYDGVAAPNFVQLSEYWYRQKWGNFSFKIGRIDPISDLALTHAAALLLNNSYETLPTIAGFPTYPSPAPGAVIKYSFPNDWSLKLGIFGGYEALVSLKTIYPFGYWNHLVSNLMVMVEVDGRLFQDKGRVAFGVTHNQAEYSAYGGPSKSVGFSGYLISEYAIKDHCHTFLQLAMGDPSVVNFPYYIGAGIEIGQLLPIDLENTLVLGVASGFYSQNLANQPLFKTAEASFEIAYRVVYKNIGIQPDLQYIINPNRIGVPNALGFILSIDVGI